MSDGLGHSSTQTARWSWIDGVWATRTVVGLSANISSRPCFVPLQPHPRGWPFECTIFTVHSVWSAKQKSQLRDDVLTGPLQGLWPPQNSTAHVVPGSSHGSACCARVVAWVRIHHPRSCAGQTPPQPSVKSLRCATAVPLPTGFTPQTRRTENSSWGVGGWDWDGVGVDEICFVSCGYFSSIWTPVHDNFPPFRSAGAKCCTRRVPPISSRATSRQSCCVGFSTLPSALPVPLSPGAMYQWWHRPSPVCPPWRGTRYTLWDPPFPKKTCIVFALMNGCEGAFGKTLEVTHSLFELLPPLLRIAMPQWCQLIACSVMARAFSVIVFCAVVSGQR